MINCKCHGVDRDTQVTVDNLRISVYVGEVMYTYHGVDCDAQVSTISWQSRTNP